MFDITVEELVDLSSFQKPDLRYDETKMLFSQFPPMSLTTFISFPNAEFPIVYFNLTIWRRGRRYDW